MNRHCDKCNLEVLSGSVLSTLCLDGAAHHLVDNVAAPAVQQAPVPTGKFVLNAPSASSVVFLPSSFDNSLSSAWPDW